MNVDQPSAGSVSTRNDVNAKAAKTTTKNKSRGRAERRRGAILGANSTAKAEMLFGLASRALLHTPSGAFLHPWTTPRPRCRSPRAAARDAARRPFPAHGDPWGLRLRAGSHAATRYRWSSPAHAAGCRARRESGRRYRALRSQVVRG